VGYIIWAIVQLGKFLREEKFPVGQVSHKDKKFPNLLDSPFDATIYRKLDHLNVNCEGFLIGQVMGQQGLLIRTGPINSSHTWSLRGSIAKVS
jgi:hypothetical protein